MVNLNGFVHKIKIILKGFYTFFFIYIHFLLKLFKNLGKKLDFFIIAKNNACLIKLNEKQNFGFNFFYKYF